ncbi:MAG: O-antigen ligase family protein [Clostridiales bacterium]|nr:O-antigen ligase family protein [Clostridiales bacterium]
MNSVIISWLCGICHAFVRLFTESGVYKTFLRVYSAFSTWWESSCIMNFLKKNDRQGIEKNSILYRIIRIPFTIFAFIGRKTGTFVSKTIEESFIIGLSKDFMNNALALNTRFLGCMLLAALSVREIITVRFSVLLFVVVIAGIVLALSNYNITDFFSESRTVNFCLSALGFKNISWNFYDKKALNKPGALAAAIIVGAAAGAVSTKSLILAFAIPVGLSGMFTVMAYPVVGVFGAVLAAPFVPTMILAGICALTFLSVLVKSLVTENFRWRVDSVGVTVGLFLLFMFISSIFSFAPGKSLMVWGMYLIFAGFYFVIINTVRTKEQLYTILKLFVLAGAVVSLYGIIQYVFGWNTSNAWIDESMFEEATMRAYSTMENPNVLGEYLLLLIPITAVFMLKPPAKRLEKWVYTAIFLMSILCMVFTQSRGCWLGLILTAMIFVTFYNGKLWGLLPVLLVILPFVIPQTMVERLMSIGNTEDSSTSYRVFIWLGTLEMLKDFWIGGIGMGEGAFRRVYPIYSYNAIIAPHSHNTFLQMLVEGGIGALMIFLSMMAVTLRRLALVYRNNCKGSMAQLTALAIGSGICGFLLQSMFDYTFYNYRMMAMFFMIIALGISLQYVKEETHD